MEKKHLSIFSKTLLIVLLNFLFVNNSNTALQINANNIVQATPLIAKSITNALKKAGPLLLTNQDQIKKDLATIFAFIECQKTNPSAQYSKVCPSNKDIKKVLTAATRFLRLASITLLGTPDEPGPVVDLFTIAKLFLTGQDQQNIDDIILPIIILFVQITEFMDILDSTVKPLENKELQTAELEAIETEESLELTEEDNNELSNNISSEELTVI